MNEFVNKANALEFLDQEIKEISGRWISSEISRRAVDVSLQHLELISAEIKETYEKVSKAIKGSKKKPEYVLKTFTNDEQDAYFKVKKFKDQESAQEKINDNMRAFEEFLEVATKLKNEIQ